ncbi:MAG: amidohydrolase family protein [Rhizorhabdus sp.]
MAEYDLIIRGGTIADGTGAPLQVGDVAVKDGVIVAVGELAGAGREEIDAQGKLVTPGFVDIHTHYDAQVTWDTRFSPSTNHGVTTVLMGNCGVGFAPCRPEQREQMIDTMEGVEDIPNIVMAEGLPWNWETFPDYLDALEARPMDADFAVAIPHIPIRVWVMGQRAIDREPSTPDDIRQMAALVAEGIEAGAFGFSTTRVIGHRDAHGAQLPVTTASEDELLAMALAMKPFGKQLFMSSSEFDTSNGFSSEFNLLARIAQASGHTVTFPLLQYDERPEQWRDIADACADVRSRGVDMLGQVVARPVGVLFGLELKLNPFQGCPTYDRIANLPLTEQVAILRRDDTRAALVAEYERPLDPAHPAMIRLIARAYAMGENPVYDPGEADRFDHIAAQRGCSVAEIALDTMLADEGRGIIYFPARNYTYYNFDVVEQMLGREDTILGLGDGGAHVGAICDGSMQTYILSYWTRDRVGKTLPVEQAVKLMTSDTAEVGGFHDRGRIAVGYKADLNVIDYDNLRLGSPRAAYDLPAGGRRLYQEARGYEATIVSGVVTARYDKPTGALPGRLLRGRRLAPAL